MSDQGGITIDDLLAEAVPRSATARILLRQDLLEEHARLDAELQAAVAAALDEVTSETRDTLATQLAELEAQIEAAQREFTFRALGRRAWADLMAKHPPTKDQLKANPRLDHNPETFPFAAIAASCVAPALTVDHVKALDERLNVSEFDKLWVTTLEANVGADDRPKSLLAGSIRRVSAAFGRTASLEGSPAASS